MNKIINEINKASARLERTMAVQKRTESATLQVTMQRGKEYIRGLIKAVELLGLRVERGLDGQYKLTCDTL